jgi:hypothetical protein
MVRSVSIQTPTAMSSEANWQLVRPAFVPRTTGRRLEMTRTTEQRIRRSATRFDHRRRQRNRPREHSQGGDTGSNPVGTTTVSSPSEKTAAGQRFFPAARKLRMGEGGRRHEALPTKCPPSDGPRVGRRWFAPRPRGALADRETTLRDRQDASITAIVRPLRTDRAMSDEGLEAFALGSCGASRQERLPTRRQGRSHHPWDAWTSSPPGAASPVLVCGRRKAPFGQGTCERIL